jgi:hypothetical protein
VTDGAGECSLRGVGLPRIRVTLYSPTLGMRPSELVDLAGAAGAAIELVLDPEHELVVQVLEGAQPLRWVQLRARDSSGVVLGLADRTSDDAGIARWQRVSTGRYLVEVRHPGFWPTRTEIEVGPGSKVHTIQARRIGDLRVVARSKLGNPRANVAFALRSIDLDQDVDTWIAHGRIVVEGGMLATNAAGESIVRGLAAGAYAWSSTDEDGESMSGTVRVEGGRRGELVLE